MYPGRRTYDPDLDIQPRPPSLGPTEPVEAFQRLVANPFLTFFAWLVAFGLVVQSLHRLNLALFVAGLALLFLAFLLLQFHCLDCGATGWLLRASAACLPGGHRTPPDRPVPTVSRARAQVAACRMVHRYAGGFRAGHDGGWIRAIAVGAMRRWARH